MGITELVPHLAGEGGEAARTPLASSDLPNAKLAESRLRARARPPLVPHI